MVNVRARKDTGKLFFDFYCEGRRCREYVDLTNNVVNRKKMTRVAKKISTDISNGVFDYSKFFPNSKNLMYFEQSPPAAKTVASPQRFLPASQERVGELLPSFNDFADTWVSENEISWRRSNKVTVLGIINGYLKPAFGENKVSHITKAEILAFRSGLAKVPGRKNKGLSPKRMNSIMTPLRQILNEAADRYEYNTPYRNIKPLKVPKVDVEPFTLDEVSLIIERVRIDFRPYYTVRVFTGMRTGEIDGLKWKYIDFEKRLILIRETVVAGQEEYTKNDSSQREIQMSNIVYDALREQEKNSKGLSNFVFCNKNYQCLEHTNVSKRVWYPLLRHLGLKERRPYQTRHTAATLWLASGESPEWIAQQMGHTSTEMLFRVYSRFVPNLTRQDGSAFERLLASNYKSTSTMEGETDEQQ